MAEAAATPVKKSWGDDDEEIDFSKKPELFKNSADELAAKVEGSLGLPSGEQPKDEDDPVIDIEKNKALRGPGLLESSNEINVQQADPNSPLYSVKSFEELNLRPELLKGVYAMKFNKPSKIQEKALPMIISDPPKHLIGQSQAGTGKTAAFVLGMLSRIDPAKAEVQALCIAPTRELSRQIGEVIEEMGQFLNIKIAYALKDAQTKKGDKKTEHVVLGTPGSILDWLKKGVFDPKKIKIFVLDEADVMMDQQGMGDQSIRIKKTLAKNCQILLFSATFKPHVKEFSLRVVPNANIITLKREELTLDGVKQYVMDCRDENHKYEVLCDIYGLVSIGQVIIFCHTKKTVQELNRRMTAEGHTVSLLHGGDMDSSLRDKVIDDFRNGKTKVLITTNVLARGIDILQVNVVINYDIPLDARNRADPETYLHRIGRTGRFGRKGVGINFVHDESSRRNLRYIEKFFGKPITSVPTDDPEEIEKMLKI